MSDMICRYCGEPWDIDCLHDIADENNVTWDRARDAFLANGCVALAGEVYGDTSVSCRRATDDHGPSAIGEAFALLADLGDLDGAIADVEDFRQAGLL